MIAEDQGMVLGALAALLEIEGDIAVVARSRNGKEALQAVLEHKPDVFITDIEMPEMTGLDVAGELKRRRTGTRVIILTTFARAGYLRRALEAGASGYLLKDMRSEELAEAVRRVQQGLRVIDPELATEAWAEPDPLTDRERQVLRLAGDGVTSGDIAAELSSLRGNGSQLSVGGYQQAGREQPGRGGAYCPHERLAVKGAGALRGRRLHPRYNIPLVFTVRIFNALSSLDMASASSGCSPILLRSAFSSSWAPETCSTTGACSGFCLGSGLLCDGMGSRLQVALPTWQLDSQCANRRSESSLVAKPESCQPELWWQRSV